MRKALGGVKAPPKVKKGEDLKDRHPLWMNIAGKDGLSFLLSHSPTPLKKEDILVAHRMLSRPLRDYVIREIKAPLQNALTTAKRVSDVFKVLILVGKRFKQKFGEITKENTVYPNTHIRMDIRDKFFKYLNNKTKEEMLGCGWTLYIAECEHDRFYRYFDEWYLEERIKAVLSGEWQPRLEGWPEPKYWKEPEPYGGEHSIVYKLQAKREEILKLIGEE